MGFLRQDCWSGLPFPSVGDLLDPGIEPMSLMFPAMQADSLPLEQPEKPTLKILGACKTLSSVQSLSHV